MYVYIYARRNIWGGVFLTYGKEICADLLRARARANPRTYERDPSAGRRIYDRRGACAGIGGRIQGSDNKFAMGYVYFLSSLSREIVPMNKVLTNV